MSKAFWFGLVMMVGGGFIVGDINLSIRESIGIFVSMFGTVFLCKDLWQSKGLNMAKSKEKEKDFACITCKKQFNEIDCRPVQDKRGHIFCSGSCLEIYCREGEIKEKEFVDILIDVQSKYQEKKGKYGVSWKQMFYPELLTRLREEIKEFEDSKNYEEMYKELLDMINVALMLGVKLKQRNKVKEWESFRRKNG